MRGWELFVFRYAGACVSVYWFVVLQRALVAWRALSVPAGTVLPVADQAWWREYIDA
jgi:hypothetical protein